MFPPCWKLADLGPPDHPRRIGTVRYKLEKLARTWKCGQGYKEFELRVGLSPYPPYRGSS